jgi:hypothetical protein
MAVVRWDGVEVERSVGGRVAPGGGDGTGLGEVEVVVERSRNEFGTDCSGLVGLFGP